MDAIQISEESYLPVIEEFDMKFDSSASDNIKFDVQFISMPMEVLNIECRWN